MSLTYRVQRKQEFRDDAGPVLKWAGGKGRLLAQLEPLLPNEINRYHEPFFGGGALYFRIQPGEAFLSDLNDELVCVYTVVRDSPAALISALKKHRYEKNHYYRVRATDPETLSQVERAARTIYLNRTCFNGLYRVNRRGHFNVPMGRYANPKICQEAKLLAASSVLSVATIEERDYRQVLDAALPGDFVYFDPPYHPISKTANFTSYTSQSFSEDDQAALARIFAELDKKGVQCMLSNSDTPFIRGLFDKFRTDTVLAPRAISRKSSGRKAVNEVVVRNY
jgi:DNA adenine methylase